MHQKAPGDGGALRRDKIPGPSHTVKARRSSIIEGAEEEEEEEEEDEEEEGRGRGRRRGRGRGRKVEEDEDDGGRGRKEEEEGYAHRNPSESMAGHARMKKRRRSRASAKPPLHVFPADASNFMAMVHHLTGIPSFPSSRGFHVSSSVSSAKSFPFMKVSFPIFPSFLFYFLFSY